MRVKMSTFTIDYDSNSHFVAIEFATLSMCLQNKNKKPKQLSKMSPESMSPESKNSALRN